ncbi:Dihydrofolate reductase [Devosia enhydra]|uniref:Dihydrofolate reductase n=1 Tax=Devosia enhydra TaxID=665118 RepID=A0A1K2I357_9HYPH|nr:dihydrofolate reductase family protein [Devosia enhydra]SFZ86760.1 Dihydrofolate reductase [Devosia enhydra]
MGDVVYSMMASIDGFINDARGDFEWGQINEAVHRFAEAEQARETIALYGRRMYEMMAVWEKLADDPKAEPAERDFGRAWQKAEKIVVSTTLETVTTPRTRLLRSLDAETLRALKASTEGRIGVSGPGLAAHCLAMGLVDEINIYTVPVLVGSGTPMFPLRDSVLKLTRTEQRNFDNGVSFARYSVG